MKKGKNMRELSVSMVAFAMALCVTVSVSALEFDTAKPVVIPKPMIFPQDKSQALDAALSVHNAMNKMYALKQKQEMQASAKKNLALQQKKMEAMEKCNIGRLAKDFKHPEQVWKKMTDAYDKREKELIVYVNSADEMTEEDRAVLKANIKNGYFSDEALAETMSFWDIGNEILTDVYQNQDAWGERVKPGAPSFPLWEDQKYVFDQEWNQQYEEINLYFGVPPEGRPVIGDEKYDYAKEEQVNVAHKAYLAALTAKNPAKAAAMPKKWLKAQVAPKPLPPKAESIVYLTSDDPERQIYPKMPAPWEAYQKDGFKDINPTGEMAEDFAKGLVLKESAKNRTTDAQNNRLTVYQALKKTLDGAEKIDEAMAQSLSQTETAVLDQLHQQLDLDGEIDLNDAKEFEQLFERLKNQKNALLVFAEQNLKEEEAWERAAWRQSLEKKRLEAVDTMTELQKENPAYYQKVKETLSVSAPQQNRELLTALRTDENAIVSLSAVNAKDIERLMREAVAEEKLLEKQDAWNKELAAEEKRSIDDLCINGGV